MAVTKKQATKSSAKKATGGRKYSPAASASVKREMKAMKQGKLHSGSGAKVTNPKQAIAIGLSEARREGDQAPEPPGTSTSRKIGATAKAPGKKAATKKAAAKKAPAKKTATKKSAALKSPLKKKAE